MARLEKKNAGLPVSKPAVVKVAPYKADWKGFFSKISGALAKGGGAYLTLQLAGIQEDLAAAASTTAALTKFVEIIPELVASLATVQASSPGEKGYLLVKRALVAAIAELVEECAGRKELREPDASFDTAKLTEVLDATDWVLASDFFERPRDLEILPPLKDALTVWLSAHKLQEPQARAIAERLPSYFVFALRDEWLERPELYKDVETALKSPMMTATRHEQEWVRYEARLERQIADRVFLETFSLEEIFIPLNAEYREKNTKSEAEYQEKNTKSEPTSLAAELRSWIASGDKADFLRVLSGGPGSGKSSAAKMLAAELGTTHGRRTLYIPLGDVNLKGTLQASVADYLERHPNLPTQKVLEPNTKDSVLLFLDGLDEVGMKGAEARQVAQNFVQEVSEALRALNQDTRRVLAIIGGRPLVVGDNESRFSRHGKILHLLPYNKTQRKDWWMTYGVKKGKEYEDIPQPLALETLDELTSQPLLNYLVALSYERGKVDFTREPVRVAVYEDLLKQVHERVWSPEDGNVHLKDLDYESFTALLEQVALAAWHGGDTRQAKLGAIRQRLENANRLDCLESLATKSEDGLLRLLASFYLGVSGAKLDDPDTEVEFSHKSFGDYLVARHIVAFLELMQGERERRIKVRGGGWDEEKCLDEWVERFGSSAMNFDLLNWATDTVGYREKYPDREKQQTGGVAAVWQKTIAVLLSDVLHKGVPMERVEPRLSYKEEERQGKNVESSLLVVLSCCCEICESKISIRWPVDFRLDDWIRKIWGSHTISYTHYLEYKNIISASYSGDICTKCVSNFLFDRINLRGCSFGGYNLRYGSFVGSIMVGSCLVKADIGNSNFEGANLFGALLIGADLSGANLKNSFLIAAQIHGAKINGADFRGCRSLEEAVGWETVEGFNEAIFDPDVLLELHAIRSQKVFANEDRILLGKEYNPEPDLVLGEDFES